MKNKLIKILLICIILIGGYIGIDIFTHSTVERTIRTDLFFRGYFISAFTTEIIPRSCCDSEFGQLHFCKNPSVGPDSYKISKKHKYLKKINYMYVNINGTGGG